MIIGEIKVTIHNNTCFVEDRDYFGTHIISTVITPENILHLRDLFNLSDDDYRILLEYTRPDIPDISDRLETGL